MKNLNEFEEKIGYKFNDKKLIESALTHKSFAYQGDTPKIDDYNERLEFLGDAILEHVISEKLYKYKPSFNEGNMSKKRASIVCEKSLSAAMIAKGLDTFMKVGKCELANKGRGKTAIIADMFEAILGAIYLDGGFDEAIKFCDMMLSSTIQDVIDGKGDLVDYKTELQELAQKHGNAKIEYRIISEEGPDHAKNYVVALLINDEQCGEGKGKNKKEAQQAAAKNALGSGVLR